jgi:hypothetical protein
MVDGLMQRKRTCGYFIENVFADDVAALASWKSASHVENPPKKKAPPTPPTPRPLAEGLRAKAVWSKSGE